MLKSLLGLCLAAICFVPSLGRDTAGVAFFNYAELADLYNRGGNTFELESRLDRLLITPFVSNENAAPSDLSRSDVLGEFIRVANWNIERGIEYPALEAGFAGDEELAAYLDPKKFPAGSTARREILDQAAQLRRADVIVLNEVDWGIKRSGYRNIAAELARRLGLNYAFGVEFLELSPLHLSSRDRDGAIHTEEAAMRAVDSERYKGMHGIAILSRFPLENVRLVPYKHQPYNWFEGEIKGVSLLEKARRKLVKEIFLEGALCEVRRGGRTILMADIVDTRIPGGRTTIVGTHLEIRTSPENRRLQLAELLSTIRDISNPVIVAGDMNTSTTDMTPTSIARELQMRFGKPEYLVKQGVNLLLGLGIFEDAAMASLTFGRNHGDPTVRHIPILMPNSERRFFSLLKDFRFADGGAFDFRGEASRSWTGKRNTLANSNERDKKGFVTTFRLERPVKFIGRYKLDWIFVKPASLSNPSDYQASYAFAPHFGRTLGAVNSIADKRISDHSPMILDLPLTEPNIQKRIEK
ncbi:MAG: endonuclease/exonuclease/phosphatase family protein [Pyrinomonadaceae bacterium]